MAPTQLVVIISLIKMAFTCMPITVAAKMAFKMSTILLLVFFQLGLWSLSSAQKLGTLSSEGGLCCPTWTLPNNQSNQCECAKTVDAIVICDPATKTAYMHLTYCMSYIEELDETVFGACIYNNYLVYNRKNKMGNISTFLEDTHAYYPLPQNKSDLSASCGYLNRQGLLCGKCLAGFAPPLLSYDLKCMNCTGANRIRTWVIVCARVIVPITLLYVLLLVFRLSLLSPKLNGFILFAQFMSSPPLVRQVVLLMGSELRTPFLSKNLAYVIISMYSWSNLDFFSLLLPSVCDPHFDTFAVFVVKFISVLYPMLLVVLTYMFVELRDRGYRLVEIFHRACHKVFFTFRKSLNIRHSLIDVFASVLLISYVGFLSVSLDMLTAVRLLNIKNKKVGTFFWNYDASLELFRKSALPIVVPSFLVVCIVIFLPCLLLCGCSSRFFQLLCKRICQKKSFFLALQAFVDAFQGCYKDGTEPGTYNCRFVAALNLFFRVCLYLSYTIVLGHHYFLFTISLTLIYAVFIAILRPYKCQHSAQNVLEPLFLMLLCMLQIGMFGFVFLQTERRNWLPSIYIFISIISMIPLVYLMGVILHCISTLRLFQRAATRALHFCGRSYSTSNLESSGDDEDSFNSYIIRLGSKNYGSNGRTKKEMTEQN